MNERIELLDEPAVLELLLTATGRQHDQLVARLLALWDKRIGAVVRLWIGPGLDPEDLFSAGRLGVLEALARRKGQWSIWYTTWWIRKKVAEAVRHSERPVVESEHAIRRAKLDGTPRPLRSWSQVDWSGDGAVLPTATHPLALIALQNRADEAAAQDEQPRPRRARPAPRPVPRRRRSRRP